MDFPIVVLISGQGTNLQAIIDAIAAKKCPARIAAVVSNQDHAYGLVRAKQAGIPTITVIPKIGESRVEYDARLYEAIAPFQAQLIVLAGFMRILSPAFIAHFPSAIINIHPSLLPKYPGLNTHEKVLANGDSTHGITIHIVTDALDAGPILHQLILSIHPNDTLTSLKERIHHLEHQAYPDVISWFAKQRISLDGDTYLLDQRPLPLVAHIT